MHLYTETSKRKELADLQLLGISETQAPRLLDGWAAARPLGALKPADLCSKFPAVGKVPPFQNWERPPERAGAETHTVAQLQCEAPVSSAVGNSLLILSSPSGKRGERAGFPSSPDRQEVVDFRTEVIAGTTPLRLKPAVAS